MRDYVIFGITEDDLKRIGNNGGTSRLRLVFKDGKYSHANVKLGFIESLLVRRQFKKWNRKDGSHYELFLATEVGV